MNEVIIAGDYCPALYNYSTKLESPMSKEISDIIKAADYSVVNLECPYKVRNETDVKPIAKQGPSLGTEASFIKSLKGFGFNCTTLANNHILDYGEKALLNTIDLLRAEQIDYIGAGNNLHDASKVLYINIGEYRVAFINCCEHEFSIATKETCGTNPLDPICQYKQIKEAKNKSDYVIVIIHGGVEHYQYPTNRMVQTYRFFVDAGADAVINHHQHCPCGYEVYNEKPIYYGLGNFFFPWEGKKNSIWNLGYLVKLDFLGGHKLSSSFIPYRQCDEQLSVECLKGDELKAFKETLEELSTLIQDDNGLDAKLRQFNENNDFLYRKMLEPYSGRVAEGLYRRGFLPSTISKKRILALMDFIMCESHYERVNDFLNRLYYKNFNE